MRVLLLQILKERLHKIFVEVLRVHGGVDSLDEGEVLLIAPPVLVYYILGEYYLFLNHYESLS